MIDFDAFVAWAESRFDDVIVKGTEVRINSPFHEGDTQHRMWCSPSGGKKKRKMGVYHCFRSGEKGSLPRLVMLIDKVSYEEALEKLNTADITLHELENKVAAFFKSKREEEPEIDVIKEVDLQFPENTYKISDLDEDDFWRNKAEMYLEGRKLGIGNKLVCTGGRYVNRIIIPYYNQDGKLIYWNGRFMDKTEHANRYRGPDKEVGIGKADVVYCQKWPEPGSKLYLTEGEFDSDAIFESDLPSGALGGKALSEDQAIFVREYQNVLCLDSDKAGFRGTFKAIQEGFQKLQVPLAGYVFCPEQYGDWNEMLKQTHPNIIHNYIKKNQRPFDIFGVEKDKFIQLGNFF